MGGETERRSSSGGEFLSVFVAKLPPPEAQKVLALVLVGQASV